MEYCQCLFELENNLPRTKYCFVACTNQRTILFKRDIIKTYELGFDNVPINLDNLNSKLVSAYNLGVNNKNSNILLNSLEILEKVLNN